MADLVYAHALAGRQDRVAVFTRRSGVVLVVADGAGGTGSGGEAAQAVIDAVAADERPDREALAALLIRVDTTLRRGETTAVIAAIVGDEIHGASVGDSGAWLIAPATRAHAIADLTHLQRRKPLIGSGEASPCTFTARLDDATLLLASDGLFDYTSADRIVRCVRTDDLEAAARGLIELVRLRSGALPDDVAVALARRVDRR